MTTLRPTLPFAPLFPLPWARRTLLGLALLACAGVRAASPAPVAAEHGMVVSAHRLATQVGVDVLKAGGNAVDAAVAVGYALAVVYPSAGNLGGGGFMTLTMADGRKAFIDFREKAPLAASADMYLGADGIVKRQLSRRGHLSVAVPGTVAGQELALSRYGTMPRAALLAPAVRLAEEGFELDPADAELLAAASDDLGRDPASAAIYTDAGAPLPAGHRWVQKDLAQTLRRVAEAGADGFYRGPVAEALAAASRAGGGLITRTDLEQYSARERPPTECDYRGYSIVSAPPPSSGGTVLCEMLNILEGVPLRDWGFGAARGLHWQIEAMRRAYYDRNTLLGDPDFVEMPLARLLDKAYAARLRADIDPARAGDSRRLGPGVVPREGNNTTHFNVADRFGNVVAVTTTLNDAFGARVTAAGTGVLLNDEMDDFAAAPGAPNLYGLVQGRANAIQPGKRPLSSMTPTIVLRDGRPLLALGTPGGSRIPTGVLQTLLNVVDHDMSVQEAVDAPRIHQQWLPEATQFEPFALNPDTRQILTGMGHVFTPISPAGQMTAILFGAPSLAARPVGRNRLYGATDSRRQTGLAAGY